MKYQSSRFLQLLAASLLILSACNMQKDSVKADQPAKLAIKEETVNYTADTVNMKGFVAYDASTEKKRPVVLIVPEWWGLNDYTKSRARQLASLGYLAMAVDIYGNGEIADNPGSAGKLSGLFYQNPQLAKDRFDAALIKIKTYAVADTSQVAAIGYCFGGAVVLNTVRLGEKLNGAVSFHGNLVGTPANKDLLKTPVLICHGEADKFVKPEEVATFKKQMDSINANYTFKSYPNANHAFTNPAATALGKKFSIPVEYNAAADSASWKDMKDFFAKIFK